MSLDSVTNHFFFRSTQVRSSFPHLEEKYADGGNNPCNHDCPQYQRGNSIHKKETQ